MIVDRHEKALKTLRKNFNKFIQLRDAEKAISGEIIARCLACRRIWCLFSGKDWSKFHASHYFREDKFASVRFDEDNVHGCCSVCNTKAGGNLAPYQENLIKKIGQERFDKLVFRKNQLKIFNITELEAMNKKYLQKIKEEKKRLGL